MKWLDEIYLIVCNKINLYIWTGLMDDYIVLYVRLYTYIFKLSFYFKVLKNLHVRMYLW